MVEDEVYVMLMMMRADEGYTPVEWCTAEELLACITADDYDACIAACSDENNNEEPAGDGYAKVSGKAASSQNVALNAVDKKIWTVTLKAGEYDTTVTAIEITKSWLWAKTDVANIQLMKNGEYVTTNWELNSNKVAKLRFRPNLVLKANSSETFDVVVSMAWSGVAQPGGTHDFSVTAVTVANGTFDGTPVRLGSLTTTNYLVPEVVATINNGTLKAGETNKEITRINVESPVDATLTAITLTTSNTLSEDLFNILSDVKAYIDDKVVWTVTVNEETIVISNLSAEIEKNDDIDIVLKGTDIYVWNLPSVSLELETWHVVVFEKNTNERMNSNGDTATLTLQWVDLKLTNNVTTAQNASINEKNVVLLDMTVSSSNEIEVAEFYVKFPFTGTTLASWFKEGEVTLYVDGIDYTIKNLTTTGWVWYSDKNDYFTVSANNSVKIQIKWTPTADCPSSISNIEFGITKAKNVDEKTPFELGNVIKKTSHKTNIKWGSVTVSKSTTPSANTIEMWAEQDVLFFKVKSPSEDVKLTWFNLTIKGKDSADILSGRASTPITNIAIYEEWESSPIVDFDLEEMSDWNRTTSKEISTGILFDGFNYVVSEWETINFVVKATFDSAVLDDLWDTYQVTLTDAFGQWVTSKTAISASSLSIAWTTYTVVTDKPDVELVKNGEYIDVTVSNNSDYDVVFNSWAATTDTWFIAIEIKSVATSNDNYLLKLDSLTVEVLDGENGNRLWTWTYSNWVITVVFDDQFVVNSSSEEEFTIKMVSTNEILSSYYNVSKKSADFNYYDDTEDKTSKYVNVKY